MIRLRTLLPLLLALTLPAFVQATESDPDQPKWFEIELILFQQPGGVSSNENWPEVLEPLDLEQVLPETAYQWLPPDQWRLTKEAKKLARNGAPLLHVAWRQPVPDRQNARPLYLRSTQNLLDQTPLAEGLVTVSVARYLHVQLDLRMNRLPTAGETGNGGLLGPSVRSFPLRARRRMRSGELHYIDHPLMGVLILISRYQPPAGTEPATETAPSTEPDATPTESAAEPAAVRQ